jgi:hypothetical protein
MIPKTYGFWRSRWHNTASCPPLFLDAYDTVDSSKRENKLLKEWFFFKSCPGTSRCLSGTGTGGTGTDDFKCVEFWQGLLSFNIRDMIPAL